MNEITRPPWSGQAAAHDTTQAAEGYPRLKWTLEEFEKLSELGFFGGIDRERERVELVDGELIPMNAKGARYEWVRAELHRFLRLHLGGEFEVFSEPGWRPGGERYLEPEIIVCRRGFRPTSVPPAEVLLLIEVADASFAYDAGLKAEIYAKLGVREYWVGNAKTLETRIHRAPMGEVYGEIGDHANGATLAPQFLPGLAVSLGALGIG